jgi:hypothetical protein
MRFSTALHDPHLPATQAGMTLLKCASAAADPNKVCVLLRHMVLHGWHPSSFTCTGYNVVHELLQQLQMHLSEGAKK